MFLANWLKYLESLPPDLNNRYSDHLKNTAKELDVLGFAGKVITVAGTNGKGSCVAFLESILLSAGLSTGAHISPHMLRYNERIRLDGNDVERVTNISPSGSNWSGSLGVG